MQHENNNVQMKLNGISVIHACGDLSPEETDLTDGTSISYATDKNINRSESILAPEDHWTSQSPYKYKDGGRSGQTIVYSLCCIIYYDRLHYFTSFGTKHKTLKNFSVEYLICATWKKGVAMNSSSLLRNIAR